MNEYHKVSLRFWVLLPILIVVFYYIFNYFNSLWLALAVIVTLLWLPAPVMTVADVIEGKEG
jgi:hypothetical protein